jgi:hypothetical protein
MNENTTENKSVDDVESHILNAISQIKYGAVEILIHDSRVVQVSRSEKVRFGANRQANA